MIRSYIHTEYVPWIWCTSGWVFQNDCSKILPSSSLIKLAISERYHIEFHVMVGRQSQSTVATLVIFKIYLWPDDIILIKLHNLMYKLLKGIRLLGILIMYCNRMEFLLKYLWFVSQNIQISKESVFWKHLFQFLKILLFLIGSCLR